MKYWVIILSLFFILQGHTNTLFSDLLFNNQDSHIATSPCHDDHSESPSQSDSCNDCFHVHSCCHVKLIQSVPIYDFSTYYGDNDYHEYLKRIVASPVIDEPFQPPKLI